MNKVARITTRHWLPLLGLNLFVLAAAVGTFITAQKVWTATAQLILPDTRSNLDVNLGTLGSLKNGESDFASTQVNALKVQASILASDTLLERLWVSDPEKRKFPRLQLYKKLFMVTPQEQSTIISLAVSGSSPQLANQRTIALTQMYQQRLNELRQADGSAREQFNQKKLEQARQRLTQAQTELAKFKASSGLVDSQEQTQAIVNSINTLTTEQAQAIAQAQSNQSRVKTLSTRLGLMPAKAVRSIGLGENQNYQFIRQKLAELDAALVPARDTYTDDHPKIQALLSQRQVLLRQLNQYIAQAAAGNSVDTTVSGTTEGRTTLLQQMILAESEASAQQRQANQLQRQVDKLKATLKELPAHQARLVELQRQFDVAEAEYKGLVAQAKQSNIDSFNAYPNVQLLDSPIVDLKPSSPKLSLVVLNALLASVLGSIALVLLLEGRQPLLSPKDLQAISFPIVVRIPWFKRNHSALAALGTETEIEFQRLASAISLQSLRDRRLLVTSAVMGEGKTSVTLGLARALTDLGFRVLVVDGDFRRAELSRRLGYAQNSPVSNQPVQIQPSLDLLPTLPQAGKIVEMITQGRFEQSLAAAQSTGGYDYVLVDSAPVSLTSETSLMASIIPNVLFVVRAGTSERNSVTDSLELLTQHNAQVIGLVINGAEVSSNSYYPYRLANSDSSLVKL